MNESNFQHPNMESPNQQWMQQPMAYVKASGWVKFMAIMNIIAGALTCLGIITAAIGIPMIFAGMRLLKAYDNVLHFEKANDAGQLHIATENFNKYFMIMGILTLVQICFAVLYILFMIFVGAAMIGSMGRTM